HLLQTTTVLPFCIPVIIFGTSAIKNYVSLQIIAAELFILMGISLLSVAVFPFITAYVLKINVQQ
ncbi:MAG: heme exporter protein CcmB, partial [Rhodobacteraceae bacterium]|nr:heme exporter protein CcmB [Paracoccaceae bacterium]